MPGCGPFAAPHASGEAAAQAPLRAGPEVLRGLTREGWRAGRSCCRCPHLAPLPACRARWWVSLQKGPRTLSLSLISGAQSCAPGNRGRGNQVCFGRGWLRSVPGEAEASSFSLGTWKSAAFRTKQPPVVCEWLWGESREPSSGHEEAAGAVEVGRVHVYTPWEGKGGRRKRSQSGCPVSWTRVTGTPLTSGHRVALAVSEPRERGPRPVQRTRGRRGRGRGSSVLTRP